MALFKKGTQGYSIFQMKCPRCREGDLFPTSTFSFSQPFDMHKRCPHCEQTYTPEPGFYYGAMFISYIFTGVFSLVLLGTLILGFKVSIGAAFGVLILLCIILFVWFFRISRSIWINMRVRYNPKKAALVREAKMKEKG
jgi:uncharacterized protein (DUF983 family)